MSSAKLFRFPQEIIKDYQNFSQHVQSHYAQKFVAYVINSDYRTAVGLKSWIKAQVVAPTIESQQCDDIVIQWLRDVKNLVKYTGDLKLWKMHEYWQTVDETLTSETGDCEDGAILLYVWLRQWGVPANRLLLMAGDVDGGGHCWLAYRPDNYPLNWVFLDWCYWVNIKPIEQRDFFYIYDKTIYCIGADGKDKNSKYKKIWFAFNESSSYVSLKWQS